MDPKLRDGGQKLAQVQQHMIKVLARAGGREGR